MIKPGQYKWSTNGFIFANITKNCILSPAWQFANVSLMTLANCHAGLKMHPNNNVTDKYFANKSSKTAGSIVHHVMVDNHQIIRCFFLSNNKLCRTTHNVQSDKFHTSCICMQKLSSRTCSLRPLIVRLLMAHAASFCV